MDDNIDQFGRNKSQSQNLNLENDKSKKILESLSEIKEQLQDKNYTPETEQPSKSNNFKSKNNSQINSNFEELNLKILKLEEKLIALNELLENDIKEKNSSNLSFEEKEIEGSFFQYFDKNLEKKIGKSLLIVEKDYVNNSKIKFYHFILIILTCLISLILLTSYKSNISISEIINIFI